MDFPVMAGTLLPQQQQQQGMQQALIEALRGQQQQQAAPAQQGRVVSANADPSGMNTNAIGQVLGDGISGIGNNLSTAKTYGTNPFSQQTNMLAAQDAAFR